MFEVSYILGFLWRSHTFVLQDKKIQKVREIGRLRHIWFEYTHSKDSFSQYLLIKVTESAILKIT